MSALELLHEARDAGVDLFLADGQVRYRGPGSATDALVPKLRAHKSELTVLLRQWNALEAALGACCAARGDSVENQAALLADCWREAPADWTWFTDYFNDEASRWTH